MPLEVMLGGRVNATVDVWSIGCSVSAGRSGLNESFIFSKFREARSRLYRRQILQENIRWKALDEIYKIYMLLHRSDLKIPKKLVKI